MVYRLILSTAPGRVDTGATYPNCSLINKNACKPLQFATVNDAIAYALAHGETPYRVQSADEAWNIVSGGQAIDESRILARPGFFSGNTLLYAGVGIVGFLFLRRRFGK